MNYYDKFSTSPLYVMIGYQKTRKYTSAYYPFSPGTFHSGLIP